MEKRSYIIILILLGGIATFGNDTISTDKPLEEIISNHLEAYGGKEKWDKVQALELKGRYTSFSVVHDFYTLKTAWGEFFSDYNIGKNRVQEGYDGATFWTIDPWQGFDFPRKINNAEQHVVMQKAELFTPFYRWQERGFQVDYKGTEMMDGTELYVVSLTRPGMPEETWYLDAETYLVYKSITRWVDFATPMDAETFYDDYRDVDGLLLPHYLEQTYSTRHTITELEQVIINPVVDQQVFAMPACPHMEKIATMEGLWDVQVEWMTRSGNWHTFDRVVSHFERPADDVLYGSISYEVSFPVSSRYSFNYNRRTNLYQMVVYNSFYSVTELYSGSFVNGSLVFDIATEKPPEEDSADVQEPRIRYFFTLGDDQSFILERKRSADQGKTWQDVERLSFTRKAGK